MKVDVKKSALIVVDAIDFIPDGQSADTVYENEIDPAMAAFRNNVAKVVKAAHEAGLPVVFVNDAHRPGLDKELDLWGDHGIEGCTQIFPEIEVADSDLIVTKRRYSGFFQTDLGLTLNELGAQTLVAVGCDTNICLKHTLADAFYRNFKTIVVEDATITFLGVGNQDDAIDGFVKLYGSEIVTTDEIVEALS